MKDKKTEKAVDNDMSVFQIAMSICLFLLLAGLGWHR